MEKEIQAALTAAKKRKPKNEGDRSELELVVNLLADALAHAATLDHHAEAYAKQQRVIEAQAELSAAQSA